MCIFLIKSLYLTYENIINCKGADGLDIINILLIVIHVMAAIVGIGPAFVTPIITGSIKTGSQLKFAYGVLGKINKFPKTGGITLLLSGVLLMIINKIGFSLLWLNISLALFVVIEIIIIGFMEPLMKKSSNIVTSHEGEDIPAAYLKLASKINKLNWPVHIMTIIIIVLMVWKP